MALLKRESPIQAFTGKLVTCIVETLAMAYPVQWLHAPGAQATWKSILFPKKNRSTTNDIIKSKILHIDIEAERRVFWVKP